MKPLIKTILLLSLGIVPLQADVAPVPKAVLLGTTNQSDRISVVLLSADSWRKPSAKQDLVVTNPKLVLMSAGSVTARKDGESLSLILHDVTAYGPFGSKDEDGGTMKLQTTTFKTYEYTLSANDWIQVNDKLLTAESAWKRYKETAGAKTSN